MIKDFKKWHDKKGFLHHEKIRPFFHEWERDFLELKKHLTEFLQ